MPSLSDVSASSRNPQAPSSLPQAPLAPHRFLLSITSRSGLCHNPCRQLDGTETHPLPRDRGSMEPPHAHSLLSEPQVSCCGVNLEIEACSPGNEVGMFQSEPLLGNPQDLGSTGRGCPWALLPLRVLVGDASQGTASRGQAGCTHPVENSSCHGQCPSAFILKQLLRTQHM